MGLVAALVVASVASVGDSPSYSMPQTWEAPSPSELRACASMAKELTDAYAAMAAQGFERDWQERWVTCELTVTDNPAPKPPKASKTPAAQRTAYQF